MASEKVKFTVGLFVASGIAIALAAMVLLGLTGFLEKGQYYVTYFNESVQGLDVDSPVKYRGVSVGRVEGIDVAPDSKLIEVVMKIESGQALETDIVAQLKSVGITGIMFVELDQKEEGEPDRTPPLSFPTKYPNVASKPSDISELLRGIDDVLGQMKSLDLEGISDRIKLAVDNINQSIIDANVKGISSDIGSSMASLSRILETERWDNILGSMEEASQSLGALITKVDGVMTDEELEIKTAIENFGRAMESANRLLADGSSLVSGTEETQARLQRQLLVIGQNLEQASTNLKELMELLADQPSQLILGQPPAPRRVD
ncbi:MAG: MCE family protein [Deltaproteobacteria bacterium]|nr:MCE family protein [Deltaproteobacteria bacterium]